MTTGPLIALCAAFVLATTAVQAAPPGYHIIDRIPGPDGGWDYVDASHGRVLVARTAAVMGVDMKTRAVTPAFLPASRGHAAIPVGSEILVTNGAADSATFFEGTTGALIATVPTGKGPDAAIFDAASGLVLVMDHKGGDVVLIDPKTHTAVARIAVGGELEAAALDGKGRAFVNVEDKNEIAVIDIAARKVTARYALTGCEGPTGVIYAAAEKLLVASCDGVAEIVRADTGKVVRSLKMGAGADGVAYDAVHRLAFVPAGRAGNMAVLALAKGDARLVETVPTQPGARTIAFDPDTGHIFLPTGQYVLKDGKYSVTPGTFELLVLGR